MPSKDPEKRRQTLRRYRESGKGKAAQKRYLATQKGKAKSRLAAKRFASTEHGKKYKRAWNKKRFQELMSTPEGREKIRKQKAAHRAKSKEKIKLWDKKYHSRPEVKERRNAYYRTDRQRTKRLEKHRRNRAEEQMPIPFPTTPQEQPQ